MSAAVLPSVVVPSVPARGAKVDARASSDAEAFGAALSEAAPAETAPEPTPKTKAETATQDVAEPASPSEAPLPANDTGTPAPAVATAFPLPPVVPTALLPKDGVAAEASASAVAPASSPSLDAEIPLVAVDAGPVASDLAREVANVRPAVITALRPARPAEPSPAASTAEALPVSEGTEADATSDAPATAAPTTPAAETTRVRDVIDRAVARPSGQGAASAETQGARTDVKAPADTASATATTPGASEPSIAKSPNEIPKAVLTSVAVDDAPAAPLSVAPTALEVRPAEAASTPTLSTLSRAAVETTAQIAAQIVRKLEGRSTRFEMALTPEDLGRVDVSLDIDADGALHATLAFDNPVAATELRGRADELRRQLIEAGFSVADDALSFSERDPSAGQGGAFDRDADPRNARAFGAASRLTAEADLSLQTPAWISLSLTPAGVDMKV